MELTLYSCVSEDVSISDSLSNVDIRIYDELVEA